MKILHLIIDHQVIERTLGVYEKVFPGMNDVVVFNKDAVYRHLKVNAAYQLVRINEGYEVGKEFDFSEYDHIIAHFMTMDMIDFLKSAPNEMDVTWEIYGADLYNQFLVPLGTKIYYSDTIRYQKYSWFRRYVPSIFNYLRELKGVKYQSKKNIKKQFDFISSRVNHIQYCCRYDAVIVEEYSKRRIPSYEIFNYSLDNVLGELKDYEFFEGEDILIGNSASYSNNHLYILECLKDKKIPGNLILPLSYGGSVKYADDVQNIFETTYSGRVDTLRDYLPLHEYNKIFTRLKSMILSAWRQESQGTAIMGLYLGVKVFMSNKSPLFKWFKDCGFLVFSLEEANESDFIEGLGIDQKHWNRSLVLSRYSDDRVEQAFRSNIK